MGDYELKPCPFCGSTDVILATRPAWPSSTYELMCAGCNVILQAEDKETACALWNRRAEPPNPPLTLEELREMEGEPVWISFVNHPNSGFWDVVETCWELFYTLHLKMYGALPLEEIGKTWLAYRRRPEDISKKEAQNGQTNHP